MGGQLLDERMRALFERHRAFWKAQGKPGFVGYINGSTPLFVELETEDERD